MKSARFRNAIAYVKNSLMGRLVAAVLVVALLSMIMFGTAAYRAISSIEKTRLQASLMTDTDQLSSRMSEEYLSLIHVSQQMMPYGSVGSAVERYINSKLMYDVYTSLLTVHENLNLTTFSMVNAELVAYYELDEKGESDIWLKNLSDKPEFEPMELSTLSGISELLINPLHIAGSRFSNEQVVSVVRKAGFSDDKERFVYVESRTNILSSVEEMSSLQGIPYYLLQVDKDNIVRYSSSDTYVIGDKFGFNGAFSDNESMGRADGYIWCAAKETFGFRNLLIIPEHYYDLEVNNLLRDLAVFSFLLIAIIFFVSYFFRKQFYVPLKHLEKEMNEFAKGDMAVKYYSYKVEEYKSLFGRFSDMKTQINSLISDIYTTEQEKRQLELDKLYYQINPHFMMNALNSAQWQATMADKPELASYLYHLNYLLGYTLGKVNQNTTLSSEIQVLTSYLKLQQSRQDFQFTVDVEDGFYLERECARLILQPIAENAICHSIDDFGNLDIKVRQRENREVEITIKDDGPGFDVSILSFKEPPEKGTERQVKSGIGLRYVWLTLDTFYNGKAHMDIESKENKGTTVRLVLPYQE